MVMLKDFDLNEWFLHKVARVIAAGINLHDKWQRMTADVRAAQDKFNDDLNRAADIVGVDNVDRLMRGQPPRLQYDVWPEIRARHEAAAAAAAARPPRQKFIYMSPSLRDSPRDMQDKFNKACEAYVAKHGIVALEEALKPLPTPVPVSDPEPPRRPPGKHYR